MKEAMCDIGIVCSHPRETRALAARLKNREKKIYSLFTGYTGSLLNYSCVIIESGMGGDRAYIATKQLIPLWEPRLIIDFGVAAGVNPELFPGAVFMAEKAWGISRLVKSWERTDPFFTSAQNLPEKIDGNEQCPDPGIMEEAKKIPDVHTGIVGSADFFLKSKLVREEFSRRGIDSFNYETFAVFQAANEAGVPCISIRGISDTGGENAQPEFRKNLKKAISGATEALIAILGSVSLATP